MRSAAAILILVILIPTTFVVLFVSSIRANFLQSTFFKSTLARESVYRSVLVVADDKLKTVNLGDNPLLTTADIQAMASRIVTEAWLRESVERVLDQAFGWFNSSSSKPLALIVDLRDPKQRAEKELEQIFDKQLAQWPVCGRSQKTVQDRCRPAGVTDAQIKAEIQKSGQNPTDALKQIPDSLDLLRPDIGEISLGENAEKTSQPAVNPKPAGNENALRVLQQAKDIYQQGLTILNLSYAALGVLVLGYLALVWRGVRRTVRWTGVLLFSIGILPLGVGYATDPVVRQVLLLKIHFSQDFASIAPTIIRLILDVRQAIFQPLFLWGLALVLAGVACIVSSYFLPKRQPKPKAA